jgi:hypothetical protein
MERKVRLLMVLVVALSVHLSAFAQERQDVGEKLLIPSSAKTGAFTSLLVVLNQGSQPNNVTIKARHDDGSPLGQDLIKTLPVGGRFRSADILNELGVPEASNSFGPISVESTNGTNLSAVSDVASSQGPGGSFPGVNIATAWTQGFISDVVDTGNSGTAKTFRTNLGLNTVGGSSATVTISLHDDSGNPLGTASVSVPGNGLRQVNRDELRGLLGVSAVNGYLKLVSDTDILAWASKIENGTGDPSFQIGIAAASVSQFAPAGVQMQNNVLFVVLALLAPLVCLLWQRKYRSESDLNDRRVATASP